MASFDKEIREFDQDASKVVINVVDVFRRLLNLPNTDSAKAFAYAYRLQTEAWMREELVRLENRQDLEPDVWQFLNATYVCAAGNAFFSMTSCRYGGEVARISGKGNGEQDTLSGSKKRRASCSVDQQKQKRSITLQVATDLQELRASSK